jgi:2-amino-4-hydroxy-6-hydroxymethyldihydropteridine diphosphokinase
MEKTVKTVILAMGSNLGDRSKNITIAINRIQQEVGYVISTSELLETIPFNMESTETFLNSCIKVQTALTPLELLHCLQEIETDLGRPKNTKGKKVSRTIDIDIIFYDSEVIETTELCIPHKEYHTRNFVLIPLLQIAPNFIDPSKHLTVKQLIN